VRRRLTELARGEVGGSAEDALETGGELVGHWWSEFLPREVVLVLRFRFGRKETKMVYFCSEAKIYRCG
jgi:hypothetical protein